ncbi:hypothetical protein DUD52_01790 [Listeria monocytogenes]|nr:hypothetical protein [Listeria monocytogenes]
MSTLEELNEIAGELPAVFLKDINARLTDWFSAGGREEDNLEEFREKLSLKNIKHGVTLQDNHTHTVIPFESIEFIFIEKLECEA